MADETRLDRMVTWFKNNRLFSIFLLGALVLVGASELVGAISSLIDAGRSMAGPSTAAESSVQTDSKTKLLKRVGSKGTGLGYFNDARYLMLDGNRQIAVGEYRARGRIQRFRTDGTALGQWYLRTTLDAYPQTISVDKDGHLIVGRNENISEYDLTSGALVKSINLGEWDQDYDVIATGRGYSGNVVILYQHKDDLFICNDVHALQNCLPVSIPANESDEHSIDWRPRLAIDGEDNSYLIDQGNSFVYKISRQGQFLNRFGGEGMTSGLLHMPNASAVDGKGLVYVHDGNGLQIFDGSGRFITSVVLPGLDGDSVYDMAFDQDHNLWTLSYERLRQYSLAIE